MQIGKIVSSNSHTEYICQIYGPGDAEALPAPEAYGFGAWVRVGGAAGGAEGSDLVGVVYDTTLRNPEFGNLGPRLSPQEDLAVFTPDYLAEKVTLVAIAVLGRVAADGRAEQGVPVCAAQSDTPVRTMADAEIAAFHRGPAGLRLAYLPRLATMNHPLAPYLMAAIVERLALLFPAEASRLAVLRGNLAWRARVEPVR
ncbi:MAG: hypothetical protein V1772_09635 [Chloroflexota bacterium]